MVKKTEDDNEMKGGEKEMNGVVKQEKVISVYKTLCPICKILLGEAQNEMVAYHNLEAHLRKHLRQGEITEAKIKTILSAMKENGN